MAEVARELGRRLGHGHDGRGRHGLPLVDDPDRIAAVQQLGLDKAKYQKAGPRRHTRYATGFVDLDREQLLDVVPGRTAAAVHAWLTGRPADWLRAVTTVAIDPHQVYANGVNTLLGHATLESLDTWRWALRDDLFWRGVKAVHEFSAKHGHIRVPRGYNEGGFDLSFWIDKQRRKYNRGKLQPNQVEALSEIEGWDWAPRKVRRPRDVRTPRYPLG